MAFVLIVTSMYENMMFQCDWFVGSLFSVAAGPGIVATGVRPAPMSRSSASRVMTMILILRFVGLKGLVGSSKMLDASPTTRANLSSGMPAAINSRRDALARSDESSQLL